MASGLLIVKALGDPVASEIKIRTLPRANEKPVASPAPQSSLRATIGLASLFVALSAALGVWWLESHSSQTITQRSLAAAPKQEVDAASASVNHHIYNAHLKEEMLKRRLQLENQQVWAARKADGTIILPDISTTYGVQMDHEKSIERVYDDLHASDPAVRGVNLEDKVNSLLANRKWMNELERAERVTFVRNFIRQAYDRGWEVQLDQNLIVTGVRRITEPKQVNINQVLDRLAQKEY